MADANEIAVCDYGISRDNHAVRSCHPPPPSFQNTYLYTGRVRQMTTRPTYHRRWSSSPSRWWSFRDAIAILPIYTTRSTDDNATDLPSPVVVSSRRSLQNAIGILPIYTTRCKVAIAVTAAISAATVAVCCAEILRAIIIISAPQISSRLPVRCRRCLAVCAQHEVRPPKHNVRACSRASRATLRVGARTLGPPVAAGPSYRQHLSLQLPGFYKSLINIFGGGGGGGWSRINVTVTLLVTVTCNRRLDMGK